MNPLTNVRNIAKLNEQELKLGIFDSAKSWHSQYKHSAYIFIGGLPYELTEGDVLCVFSQYGEIVNINLVRDKKTGKSKGYGFIAYEDQKSTILAVDNLNGIKLGGRTIRVDHVEEYRRPKGDEKDESGKFKEKEEEGCAPKTPSASEDEGSDGGERKLKRKKSKKEKKKKKAKKAERKKKTKDNDSDIDTSEDQDYQDKLSKKQAKKDDNRKESVDTGKHNDRDRTLQRDENAYHSSKSKERSSDGRAPQKYRGRDDYEDRRKYDKYSSRHKDGYEGNARRDDHKRSRSRSPYRRR